MARKIAVYGSTGSIGTQALEVIEANPDKFTAEILVANNNADLLINQAKRHQPNTVVIVNEAKYEQVQTALEAYDIKVYAGQDAATQLASSSEIDVFLAAIVGFAGLLSTIEAIKAGTLIALANKETLVVAGALIQELCAKHQTAILPVDSEHSAIFQCLVGEHEPEVEKIILTASGGPFRNFDKTEFQKVTVAQALKHPNWDMGAKITIDSASMMNKCLEVIEAKWLFNLNPKQIDVIVHPQSLVHSFVQFVDGSLKAQIGLPDMKLPIQYAMGYPDRVPNQFERLDLKNHNLFDFQELNPVHQQAIALSKQVLAQQGNSACILNAANEVAVAKFIDGQISFLQIYELVETALAKVAYISNPSLDDLLETDSTTREFLHKNYN